MSMCIPWELIRSSPFAMFRPTLLLSRRVLSPSLRRRYATPASPTGAAHALVLVEHHDGSINPGSLSALTAAQNLGGQVSLLIVGNEENLPGIVDKAKKYDL
jgi:electron transfer flavoprotein alpha subunit